MDECIPGTLETADNAERHKKFKRRTLRRDSRAGGIVSVHSLSYDWLCLVAEQDSSGPVSPTNICFAPLVSCWAVPFAKGSA
jgi:hypothetical protein